jgi:5-methyltetrahydrofolate--homocysteine methyltransferase
MSDPAPAGLFEQLLSERILILDGAMGSMIHRYEPTEADYRGERFRDHPIDLKNASDVLVLSQPQMIADIHRQYLEAGADLIETNTFGATRLMLDEFQLGDLTHELNVQAAQLVRRVADEFTERNPSKPRFVAGSIGPTKFQLSFNADQPGYRPVTFDQLAASYAEQVRGLLEGGVDVLLPETSFDTLNMKACLFAIQQVFDEGGRRVPVMVSGTIFQGGRTLTGQTLEAFWAAVSHFPMVTVGLNCALGPRQMRPYLEALAEVAPKYISCYPNAGMPDGMGGFDSNPQEVAGTLREFAQNGWVNIVGGCCGTTPDFIRAIAAAVADQQPRQPPASNHWSYYSGTEVLVLRGGQESRVESQEPEAAQPFLMVGERTNVTGSRKFARLIKDKQYDEALSVARQQVESGANMIDVNLDEGLLDSEAEMVCFLNLIADEPDVNKVPVMVDSSKYEVIEAGLKCLAGKGVVNSISLKEGEAKFLEQARRIRRYGAAVVVMAFDEEGQATDCRAGRVPPGRHHFRRQHPHRRHGDGGARELRRRVHRGGPAAQAGVSACEDLRRRQQRLVLVPRQRRRPRGDERGVPVPRHSGRAGYGDRQRRPARGLRRDRQGTAGTRRGRAAQPPRGRHRTVDCVFRTTQGEPGARATGVGRRGMAARLR